MEKMTIKEIQSVAFEVLLEIDRFCKKAGIRYFLDSGTLIGAIRHKGFIPWDDDIDIVMPRPDYDRFVKEFVDSDNYKLYDWKRKNSYLSYARVCEMKKTFFQAYMIWTEESPGIGIDVLPLDGCSEDSAQFTSQLEAAKKLTYSLWELRQVRTRHYWRGFRLSPWGFAKDVVHFLSYCWRRIFIRPLLARKLAQYRKLVSTMPYEVASNCFYFDGVTRDPIRKHWKRAWFDSAVDVEFNGKMLPVPVGYDERLKAEYGDYMTPPAENNRGGHEGNQEMFWR